MPIRTFSTLPVVARLMLHEEAMRRELCRISVWSTLGHITKVLNQHVPQHRHFGPLEMVSLLHHVAHQGLLLHRNVARYILTLSGDPGKMAAV